MASLSEGKKARQEAMAIELKFHQEKLKQLAIDGGRVLNVEKNEAPRDIEVTLIFGYASVIWKPGFPYVNKWWGYIEGYSRRFWQGSPDHRGTPRYPGRVATLLKDTIVAELEDGQNISGKVNASLTSKTWGVIFQIESNEAKNILSQLDHREKAGFARLFLPVVCEDGKIRKALVYAATRHNESFLGPSHMSSMAWHIYNSKGPSGPNKEYLYNLYESLIVEKKQKDSHIEKLYKICRSFDGLEPCTKVADFEQNQDFCARFYVFGRAIKVLNVDWPNVFYQYADDDCDTDCSTLHANALFHIRQNTNAFMFEKLDGDETDGGSNLDDEIDDGNKSSCSSSSSSSSNEEN